MVLWFIVNWWVAGGQTGGFLGGYRLALYYIYFIFILYVYKTINHILSQLSLNINDLQNMVDPMVYMVTTPDLHPLTKNQRPKH